MSSAAVELKNANESERPSKIEPLRNNAPPQQFREKRVEIPAGVASQVTFKDFYKNDVAAKLVNVSRFGARIALKGTDDFLKLGMAIDGLKITLEETHIFNGSALVVNEKTLNNASISYGLVLGENGLDLDQIDAVLGYSKEADTIKSTRQTISLFSQVRPEFKVLVADLNTLFQDLRIKFIREEKRISAQAISPNHRRRMEEHAIDLAISLYTNDFRTIYSQFQTLTETFSGDETIIHKRYFQSNFLPVTLNTPFMERAYSKPLGYAGDFGLMVMFYEYEDAGATLFDKFKHRYACNEPSAVANKNRVELLSDMLFDYYGKTPNEEAFKVASIACGPAKELELFLQQVDLDTNRRLELICLDQDPRAIGHAQHQIRAVAGTHQNIKSVFLTEDAVLGLIREKDFTHYLKNCNAIVCAGLFDYLSDRVAARMIQSMYKFLQPGGTIIIGNVSDENPDRFSMDYYMEWRLLLRSPSDLKELVPLEISSSPDVKIEVVSESLGLNLFLKISRLK